MSLKNVNGLSSLGKNFLHSFRGIGSCSLGFVCTSIESHNQCFSEWSSSSHTGGSLKSESLGWCPVVYFMVSPSGFSILESSPNMRSNGPSHSTFGYCTSGDWPQALGKVSLTIKKTIQPHVYRHVSKKHRSFYFVTAFVVLYLLSILLDTHLRPCVGTFWELLPLLFRSWVIWQVVALQFECTEEGMDVLATRECVPSVSLRTFELCVSRAGASHHLSLCSPNSEQLDNKWTLAV